MDWKLRHKDHCEVKNVRRTEIIYGIHGQRLKEYQSGKTSIDRYFSIALARLYKDQFPEHEVSVDSPAYRKLGEEETSGRILTILEDLEIGDVSKRILRGDKAYLVNPHVPSVPASHEEQQLRIDAGLAVKEATELVPLNENIQLAISQDTMAMIPRSMRKALYDERRMRLLLIDMVVKPGIGHCYGNPVFLSLKNALAYEDFICKNFAVDLQFPFNLLCSILFPEFDLSMRTGNPEDADKVLDVESEDTFVLKTEAPANFAAHYADIFNEQLMELEHKEENEAFKTVEGETRDERFRRWYAYASKCEPWSYVRYTLADHCSESLAVLAADQPCFAADGDEEEDGGDDSASDVEGAAGDDEGAAGEGSGEGEGVAEDVSAEAA
jgi:hypothetical protein